MLVRMHAASVDQGVWHLMAGLPYLVRIAGVGLRAPSNPVRGVDVAGHVEAVGENVNPGWRSLRVSSDSQAYPGEGTWRARQQRLGFLAQEPVEKRA